MKKVEIDRIIRAVCYYYPRTKSLLQKQNLPEDVAMVCRTVTRAVDESIEETYNAIYAYAPNFEKIMRTDIAEGRGYCFSPLSAVMCEVSYKKYKRMVKQGIAKRLCLA